VSAVPKEHFADRLMRVVDERHSQLVVGLDPRLDHMPREIAGEAGGRPGQGAEAAARAIIEFNRAVIDAVASEAAAVKCQIAFYEVFGVEGLRAYAETLRYARRRDLIVIGDVKRNDIGSTAEAYASAHLGGRGARAGTGATDFCADAITVNPFFGSDGMLPFLEAAQEAGAGLFALVKTSNPSSGEIQDLKTDARPIYSHIARLVEQWGSNYRGSCDYSLLGAVVGATYPQVQVELRQLMPHAVFLLPGVGVQGAGVKDVLGAFDSKGYGALVSSSRGIIYAWEHDPYAQRYGQARWREAVGAAAAEMRHRLWDATH